MLGLRYMLGWVSKKKGILRGWKTCFKIHCWMSEREKSILGGLDAWFKIHVGVGKQEKRYLERLEDLLQDTLL